MPTREQVAAGLPAGYTTALGVVWNRVVLGYAQELAMPWETALRTSGGEQFSEGSTGLFNISLFWVTTKAIDCPYCMGHCEMNWEVAGLTRREIAERSKLLAGGRLVKLPAGPAAGVRLRPPADRGAGRRHPGRRGRVGQRFRPGARRR